MARLALIVVAVLLALGLAEATLRLLPPSLEPRADPSVPDDSLWADPDWRTPPDRVFRRDPVLGYDNAPNARADVRAAEHAGGSFRFQTNGYGLRRSSEVEISRPAETLRVLVLGDSQTSGYGSNDETYSGRLEQAWQARSPGQSVEVLNAGVDGYGPQQSYLWYRERGAALNPSVVVFAVYVGNDVSDLAYGEVDGAVIDDEAGLVGPLTWLALHSALAKRVGPPAMARLRDPLARLGVEIGPPLPEAGMDALIRVIRECHGCWFQSLRQASRARTHPAAIEQSYRRLETLLRLLSARVSADGGRLAVLVIPSKLQVEPDDERGAVSRAARLLQLPDDDLTYDSQAYARIVEMARRAGLPTIEPLDDLRRAVAGRRLYYRRDWHLNPDGNRALAGALDAGLAALAP